MTAVAKIRKYLQEVKTELRKVHWPSKREFSIFFGVVLGTIITISAFFWVLDLGLTSLVELVIIGR